MRTGKELICASKHFTGDDAARSWKELLITIGLTLAVLSTLLFNIVPLVISVPLSIICSLLYVRLFVIYHDYQHNAILQNSQLASLIMKAIGIYLLAPQAIWKRSHDFHHNHNSKLTISGIGSYPTISKERFLALPRRDRFIYLMNRHPLVVIFGYFTLFIYWLNLKSFLQSPSKHLDSLASLILHVSFSVLVWSSLGALGFLIAWFIPFFVAFAVGSYLFYCQHNFPGATFKEHEDWRYDDAALSSTSFMEMSPVMNWFTGNIGYHHVHHLNSRIPFYRLPEVMAEMPELQNPQITSWHPIAIFKCFQLKLWDPERNRMITLSELSSNN